MKIVNKLFSYSNKLINVIFSFLISLSLFFAIVSKNLTLGNTTTRQTIGNQTTWITIFFLTLIFILCGLIWVYPRFRKLIKIVFIRYGLCTSIVLLVIVIFGQIIFVLSTHPSIGFDPGAIHSALSNTTDKEIVAYYSLSPNNLPLLLIQHELAVIFSTKSWLFFDFVTLILVDVSAIINVFTVYVIDSRKVAHIIYLQIMWLAVFPMIIVPYTDIWVLPFVSISLLCYAFFCKKEISFFYKMIAVIVGGVSLTCSYYLKPSAVIPVIAIIIIEVLNILKIESVFSWKKFSSYLFLVVIFIFSAFSSYQVAHKIVNQQTYIVVDSSRAMPAIHFISMGVSGEGGYNASDNLAMARIATKKEKVKYSEKILIKRLQKKGFIGYLLFLLHKQNNNVSDGTFSWLIEGNFMKAKAETGKTNNIKNIIRNIVYPEGKYLADFRYIAQIVWIFILGTVALGWRYTSKYAKALRLAIVGGMLFLLIFEGGRSRYLIQFLPVILILGSLCLSSTIRMIKEKMSWINL